MLYQRVTQIKHHIPATTYDHLRETYLNATARNMLMLHHAQTILQVLRERGLDVSVLKGLYLAETVYAGIGLRVFDDIDLLLTGKTCPKHCR